MYLSAALLWMLMGGCSSKKKGDFGMFTACFTKNQSLRLDCIYAPCKDVPNYDCEFKTDNGTLLARGTMDTCHHLLPGHAVQYRNQTKSYNCTLTRKGRREDKSITITYKGKESVKPCTAATGLLLHEAPTLLWTGVFLLLWKIHCA